MNDEEIVLDAILRLMEHMDARFDRVEDKFERVDERITANATSITQLKSLGAISGAAAAFFGWDQLRQWLWK